MNDRVPSQHGLSATMGSVPVLIAISVLLPIIYLLTAPWLALLLVTCFPVLSGDNSLAKAFEWFMYPAIKCADTVDPYGDYFWHVLSPFGG